MFFPYTLGATGAPGLMQLPQDQSEDDWASRLYDRLSPQDGGGLLGGALAGLGPQMPQAGLLAGMDSDLTPKQKRQALGQSLLRASAAMWGPSGPGSFGASIGAGINAGLDSLNDQSQRRQARQLAAMRYAQTMGPTAEMRNWAQMTQGLSNEDKMKANRVRLGLEGRASGAGIGFGDFVGADGIKRPTRQNPRTGVLEVLYNGQWMPADGGQGAVPGQAPGSGAAAPQLPQMDSPVVQEILSKANEMSQNGIRPEQIEEWISGELRSRGMVSPWQWQDSASGPASGPDFSDVQGGVSSTNAMRTPAPSGGLLGNAVAQVAPPQMPSASALAGPSAAQEAYTKTMAEEQAKLAAYDDMTRKVADRASATTLAEAQAKAMAEAQGSLGQTQASLGLVRGTINKALNHPGLSTVTGLSGRLDPRNVIPGTDAKDARALIDQLRGNAFMQAFQSLKGSGQITEVEGQKATQAIARLQTDQSDEGFRAALMDLLKIVDDADRRAVQKAQGGGGGGRTGASGNAVNLPRAVNPQTGEVRVLRNGMWVKE